MAEQNPDVLYIALERVPDAMIVAMERCRERGLTNIFFIDGDAALLRDYFAPDEVDLLYINFCDPWPGVKHAAHRSIRAGRFGFFLILIVLSPLNPIVTKISYQDKTYV